MRFLESDADLAQRRRIARRAMRPMRLKMRRGEPLTDDEQKAWDDGLQVLAKIGADKSRLRRARALPPTKEYDSKSGASGRSTGPSVTQGPSAGVAQVVSGGLPGLGRRN